MIRTIVERALEVGANAAVQALLLASDSDTYWARRGESIFLTEDLDPLDSATKFVEAVGAGPDLEARIADDTMRSLGEDLLHDPGTRTCIRSLLDFAEGSPVTVTPLQDDFIPPEEREEGDPDITDLRPSPKVAITRNDLEELVWLGADWGAHLCGTALPEDDDDYPSPELKAKVAQIVEEGLKA